MKHGHFQRVDGAYLADSHARMVAGDFEHRQAPALTDDTQDDHSDRDMEWLPVLIVAAVACAAFLVHVFNRLH